MFHHELKCYSVWGCSSGISKGGLTPLETFIILSLLIKPPPIYKLISGKMKATRIIEVWTLDSCKTISKYFIILLRANYLCFSFRRICPYFGLPMQALLNVIAADNKFRSSQLSGGRTFFSMKKLVSLLKFLTSLSQDIR